MVMQLATQESSMVAEEATAANNQTSKDDVARLLHLFKDPAAQIHWSNHYGVLNRAELDARRSSGPQSDAANSLSCLASIFNDYKIFKTQNQMVEERHHLHVHCHTLPIHHLLLHLHKICQLVQQHSYLCTNCATSCKPLPRLTSDQRRN
jgi:hypothetical protein